MNLLSLSIRNEVLHSVKSKLRECRTNIISANIMDLKSWKGTDQAMYDRLVVNDKKVDDMIRALEEIINDSDPVGKELYHFSHSNGMSVTNKTAPFGTVLIIYESRPDVTIEAACVAFKSNNRILLKGGKEAIHTNRALVECWHKALADNDLGGEWVELMEFDREQTQNFLRSPDRPLDLIVPRGGDSLISFVKEHASCPVLISGRGNNFLYIHDDVEWSQVIPIVLNAKTDKISACNALDKVLINRNLPDLDNRLNELLTHLTAAQVEVIADIAIGQRFKNKSAKVKDLSDEWNQEYLTMKIAIGLVNDLDESIETINKYSGGHSASILTSSSETAQKFMDEVDAAAVYHNASTRFTDGGQFGLGAELAISTDKIHHRGPLGLHQLVTNKWYIFGNGQIRI